MRTILMFSICLAVMATISGCDAGQDHGHSHNEKSHSHNHKSLD